ncbi:MAG: methyltransferase domain-containing protein [Flavobacteriales bacterium]|nr:methyltransferase domain-containing protein [Flavobacteriales bacterium]
MVEKQSFKIKQVSKRSFIKQFFKEKNMVGAMAPSSRFLASKMLNHLPIKEAKIIIELGPGTGVFTEKIIEKMGPNTQLIVVELNDTFFEALEKKIAHKNVHLKHGSAEEISKYLKELGHEKADLIISSLPLAVIPSEIRQNILNAIKSHLNKEGQFVQFQYSLQSRRALKKIFTSVKLNFTPFNFPPAFVYTCNNM